MMQNRIENLMNLIRNLTPQEIDYLSYRLTSIATPHPYEIEVKANSKVILDAIYRSPELTKRMLRGIIAESAFSNVIIPSLKNYGWIDTTPKGNFAYDYALSDNRGTLKVQVKLQRSEKGHPSYINGSSPYYPRIPAFKVETQKTRGGEDSEKKSTRYYRYGEFDIIAVSLQPSTGNWGDFIYSLGRWLNKSIEDPNFIGKMQPVPMIPDEYWTNDFREVSNWYYSGRVGWNGY